MGAAAPGAVAVGTAVFAGEDDGDGVVGDASFALGAGVPGAVAVGTAVFAGKDDGDGVVGGASFALGAGVPGAVAVGVGVEPLLVGEGSGVPAVPGKAFCLGSVCWGAAVAVGEVRLAGTAPGVPGLAAGLIEALGGGGSLPCCISEARWATAGGNVGLTAALPRGVPAAT